MKLKAHIEMKSGEEYSTEFEFEMNGDDWNVQDHLEAADCEEGYDHVCGLLNLDPELVADIEFSHE